MNEQAKLSTYHGREQSYIKHVFLTKYLQAAAYKTLQGHSSTFNFVDAFAGPWNVSDENNFSDASFHQALQTLDAVRAGLGVKGVAGLQIRFCLCERRPSAVKQLREYAARNQHYRLHVFQGSFEDHLESIAAVCANGFTFTFIDPTGWNIRSQPILRFLRDRNGEFLLNFMAEHVNRHAEYPEVAESFGRFLADPNWAADFDALPSDWSNEERVLCLLRRKVVQTGAALYLPDFPIHRPLQRRVKMRLLLGTNSPFGLEVFRNVQAKVEREETVTRQQVLNRRRSQVGLFSDEEIAAIQQELEGVGCPKYRVQAEERIKELLHTVGVAQYREISAVVLAEIPMRLTDINKVVTDMRQRCVIGYELPARKRVPRPETVITLIK